MKPIIDEQVKAMAKAGLFRPIDVFFLLSVGAQLALTAAWASFGRFDLAVLVLSFAVLICQLLTWLILLVFRLGLLNLQLRAAVELMPENAARMALLYQQGAKG